MADFSDNEEEFNIALLDIMASALTDIYASGGVTSIRKGDFSATYRQPSDIIADMKQLKNTIYFQKNGCVRRCS